MYHCSQMDHFSSCYWGRNMKSVWRAVYLDSLNPDRIRNQVLMTENWRKKYSRKSCLSFFDQKLQFTYVQATGEAFSLKIEHPALQKMQFILFSMFVGPFCPPGSGSGYGSRNPIESGFNPDPDKDPDPQYCPFVILCVWCEGGRACPWTSWVCPATSPSHSQRRISALVSGRHRINQCLFFQI